MPKMMKALKEPPSALWCLYGDDPEVGYRQKPPPKQPKATIRANGAKVPRVARKTATPYDTGLPPRPKATPHMKKEGAIDLSKYRKKMKAATPKQERRRARPRSAPARTDAKAREIDDGESGSSASSTAREFRRAEASVLSREAAEHLADAYLGGRGQASRKKQKVPRRVDLDYVADLRRAALGQPTGDGGDDAEAFRPRHVVRPSPATTEAIFWTIHDAQLHHNSPDHELRELRARVRDDPAKGAAPRSLDRGKVRERNRGNIAPNRFEVADGTNHRLKVGVEHRFGKPGAKGRLKDRRGAICLPSDDVDPDRVPWTDARRLSKRVTLSPPSSYVRSNHRARQSCHHPADYKICAPAVRYKTRTYSTWEKEMLKQSGIPTAISEPAEFADENFCPDYKGWHVPVVEPKSEVTFHSPIKGNRLRDSVGIIDPETKQPMTRWSKESCPPVGDVSDAAPARVRGRRQNVSMGQNVTLVSRDEMQYEDTPAKKHGEWSSLNHAALARRAAEEAQRAS